MCPTGTPTVLSTDRYPAPSCRSPDIFIQEKIDEFARGDYGKPSSSNLGRNRRACSNDNLALVPPAARLLLRHRAGRAILLMAFCTPQAPHHIVQPRVPSRERRKCARVAAADVAAGALKENQVLTEPVGQLFDFQIAHEDTVHK